MRRHRLAPAVMAASVLVSACAGADHTIGTGSPDIPPASIVGEAGHAQFPDRMIRTASGTIVSAQTTSRVLDTLAHAFAISLNDATVRERVAVGFSQSSFREGKLRFNDLVIGDQGIRARMNEHLHKSVAELERSLASTAELETYLPVRSHRETWSGGRDVQVAYQLLEGDSIIAYGLDGSRAVLSPDSPPILPTIVIVSSETDFGDGLPRAECHGDQCEEDGSGGGGNLGALYAHLYMTSLSLSDLHEGWPRGEPEIEVHVIGKHDNPVAPTTRSCSGEFASLSSHRFNMDDNTWSGSVKLANFQELSAILARDSTLAFGVWEDDYAPCSIRESGSWQSAVVRAVVVFGVPPFLRFVVGPGPGDQCWSDDLQIWVPCTLQWYHYLSYVLSIVYMGDLIWEVLGAGDDFVGLGVSASAWNAMTGSSFQKPIVVMDESGNVAGTMDVEFRTSSVPGS